MCVFHSARSARCVCSPDFHTLCGPALPEVREQKNLTLGQQNRRAYPPDSGLSRDSLFPANDSTRTGVPPRRIPASEVSQQMQIMAVISPGSKDERSVSGVGMSLGGTLGEFSVHILLVFVKAVWVRHALPSAPAGLGVPPHMLALWPAYSHYPGPRDPNRCTVMHPWGGWPLATDRAHTRGTSP